MRLMLQQVSRPLPRGLLEEMRAALARAERLVQTPSVPRRRAQVLPPAPVPHVELEPPLPPPPTPPRLLPSLLRVHPKRRDEELLLQEINGCKTLLLEVIRRAAYDWVLYRHSTRMVQRMLAEQAYRWLFVEQPGSIDWRTRDHDGKHMTSFVSICESLELDPDKVRGYIQKLTPRNVLNVGRPAEFRRRESSSTGGSEDVYTVGVLVPHEDNDIGEEL